METQDARLDVSGTNEKSQENLIFSKTMEFRSLKVILKEK